MECDKSLFKAESLFFGPWFLLPSSFLNFIFTRMHFMGFLVKLTYMVFLFPQKSHELLEAGKLLQGKSLCLPVLRCFARGALVDSAGYLSSPVGVYSIPPLPEGKSSSRCWEKCHLKKVFSLVRVFLWTEGGWVWMLYMRTFLNSYVIAR